MKTIYFCLTLLLALLVYRTNGYVGLRVVPPTEITTEICGQSIMIECQAKSTNRVTLSVRNDAVEYGSHTYERSSPQAADVGPLHLHLQNATVNPDNEFLTDFVVIGTGRQKERIHIVCSDVQSALTLSVSTKSENCSNNSKLQWGHSRNTSEVMLQWEQPNCRGWEEISYYEVILYSSESKKNKTIESFDKSELVSADVEEATVLATNICEEITLVATGKNDAPRLIPASSAVGSAPRGVAVTIIVLAVTFGTVVL